MFSIFSFSCQPIFNDSWSHNAIILICGHHHIFLYSPHNHEWQRSCYSQMGLWMFTPWIISCGNKMMWLHWVYNNKTKKQFWTTSIYSNKLSPLSFSWGPVPFHVIHQFVSNSMSHRFMFILSWTQLNRSVQAGLMWKFRSDFPSCSEFAEICHVDSFCVKNVPVFFFKNAEKYGQNCVEIPPPPPPSLFLSPNNLGFQSLRAKSLCVCVFRYWRGRGVDFQECVWSLVSPLVAKKIQDIFSQKKNRHGKFQWILSNLENRYKISHGAGLIGPSQLWVKTKPNYCCCCIEYISGLQMN